MKADTLGPYSVYDGPARASAHLYDPSALHNVGPRDARAAAKAALATTAPANVSANASPPAAAPPAGTMLSDPDEFLRAPSPDLPGSYVDTFA